jgi:hypothetical protein
MVVDVIARIMIGESAGFCLRQVGVLGKSAGSCPAAALMPACTSREAASTLRFKSNCKVMLVEPSWLDDVISETAAMRPNWRSKGVATAEAMVSGLAPGREAFTETVGNSTCGNGATGKNLKASAPASRIAPDSSDVATGRRMNGAEMFDDMFKGVTPRCYMSRVTSRNRKGATERW